MRRADFYAGSTQASVLAFGCAPLGSRVGRREALRAMARAFDAGINVFDTARSYGYGESEAIVGRFIAGRRERCIVCTKVGILPPPRSLVRSFAKPIARGVFRLWPALRTAMRPRLGALHQRPPLDVALLNQSVETSLRELRTDHIDALLLHGATQADAENDAVLGWLENLVQAGKARAWGVSGPGEVVRRVREARHPQVEQLAGNVFAPPDAPGDVVQMVHSPWGGGALSRRLVAELTQAMLPDGARALPLDASFVAEIALGGLLLDASRRILVTTMLTPEHLAQNVAAVSAPRLPPELVRACVAALKAVP